LTAQDLPTPQAWAKATESADKLRRHVGRIDAAGSSCDVTEGLTANPRAPRWRTMLVVPRWRLLVTAAVVLALTATGLILGPDIAGRSGRATAATPPLLNYHAPATPVSSRQLLLDLAERAGQQPALTPARFAYVKTQGWYLSAAGSATTSGKGGTTVIGPVIPVVRQRWVATDGSGSGRIWQTRDGEPTPESTLQPPGTLPSTPMVGTVPFPDDPARLARVLGQSHPNYGTYEWFVAASDVATAAPVQPKVQRALLILLSRQGGISVLGSVTDRAGRAGVAIATTSTSRGATTRHILVFDPGTGTLLDYEEVALKDSDMPIHLPATTSYTLWLASGYTDSRFKTPANT